MSLLRPSPQPSLRPPPGAGHTLVLSVTPADGDSAPTLGSHQGLGRVGWTQRRVGAEPEHATHRDGLARLQPSPPASSVPPARAAHQAGRPHCPQADVSPSPAAAASAGRRHRRRPTTWLSPPVRGRDTDHQVSDHGSHGRGTVPPPTSPPASSPSRAGTPSRQRTYRTRPPADDVEAQGAGVAVQDQGQALGLFALRGTEREVSSLAKRRQAAGTSKCAPGSPRREKL